MNDNSANKMWGGRFSAKPADIMHEINASIAFDKALAPQDIRASKAHAAMLAKQNIITKSDAKEISSGLDRIGHEIEAGTFSFSEALEDVHMNIEHRLEELIGPAAGRLHTARSRNDQVATSFRLYVRDTVDGLDRALLALQRALAAKAEAHASTIMPGFTHLQTAQPITFGHHLLAYVEMAARDRGRFADARRRLNECPLGSAALAGTSLPIDRHETAAALGFDKPMANSLDGVSDRDFVLETLAAAAICAVHLSRLGEEIVLWMSPAFDFIRLPDSLTTGSSAMPQKRNPDAAELMRAKAGRIAAAFQSLIVVLKGLPLAYSKDMQEDKEAAFVALTALDLALRAATAMVAGMEPNAETMRTAAGASYATATDLVEWLVRTLDMPFRQAHHATGAIVKEAERRGLPLADLPLDAFQAVQPGITADVYAVLTVERSVASRASYGGTAPQAVKKMARAWRKTLEIAARKG